MVLENRIKDIFDNCEIVSKVGELKRWVTADVFFSDIYKGTDEEPLVWKDNRFQFDIENIDSEAGLEDLKESFWSAVGECDEICGKYLKIDKIEFVKTADTYYELASLEARVKAAAKRAEQTEPEQEF